MTEHEDYRKRHMQTETQLLVSSCLNLQFERNIPDYQSIILRIRVETANNDSPTIWPSVSARSSTSYVSI